MEGKGEENGYHQKFVLDNMRERRADLTSPLPSL